MARYCLKYYEEMPDDKPGTYVAEAYLILSPWGQSKKVVASKQVEGYLSAYKAAQWLSLKTDWRYQNWLYDCGIGWGVREVQA